MLFQVMDSGGPGAPGAAGLRPVVKGRGPGPEDVTLLLHLMEERPARGTAVSLNSPSKVLVEVSSVLTNKL